MAKFSLAIVLVLLSGCATGRPYIGGGLTAEDVGDSRSENRNLATRRKSACLN